MLREQREKEVLSHRANRVNREEEADRCRDAMHGVCVMHAMKTMHRIKTPCMASLQQHTPVFLRAGKTTNFIQIKSPDRATG